MGSTITKAAAEQIAVHFERRWWGWRAWITREDGQWLKPKKSGDSYIKGLTLYSCKRRAALWIEDYLCPPTPKDLTIKGNALLEWLDEVRYATMHP
jgi:hypothetical protein